MSNLVVKNVTLKEVTPQNYTLGIDEFAELCFQINCPAGLTVGEGAMRISDVIREQAREQNIPLPINLTIKGENGGDISIRIC